MRPEIIWKKQYYPGASCAQARPGMGRRSEKGQQGYFSFHKLLPQHRNLNQKTWLDLEDYILKNADTFNLKVTVFTGPVFCGDDMLYRGFRIPAEYWKVVVMVKTNDAMSATAYLQTQKDLLRDPEFTYGSYKTYQVSIANIENLTGLNFGDLRSYEPLGPIKATAYHSEATIAHIIENPEDIQL